MKPTFLNQIEESFAVNQHCILHFNITDRYYWPEKDIGPLYLVYFLTKYYRSEGYRVGEYAPATGLTELNPDEGNKSKTSPFQSVAGQQDPVVVLNKLVSIMRKKDEKWIFIIQYGEHLAPRDSVGASASTAPGQIHALELLHRLSFDDTITKGQSRVLILTYLELPNALLTRAHGYRNIRIDLPAFEERLSFIEFLEGISQKPDKKFGTLSKDLNPKEFATITAGMPLIGIESLYLSAAYKNKPIVREDVKVAKSKSIAQLAQDIMEVSEPQVKFEDVAGLESAKDFIRMIVQQIKAAHSGVPQTLLLQGVPGCGKTYLAQAAAHELGWPLVQLRSVRGQYVGQSEQQLEIVINITNQLQPVILLFDEIDQLIGQRETGASGDSGTSKRMLARIFNWLGGMEHRGKILFIGTTNRPDIMDAALIDRFRVSIPVINPSKKDLTELIPITLNKIDRKAEPGISIEKIAENLASLKPSARSLQEILIQAGLIADHEAGKVGSLIGEDHLLRASIDYLPIEDPLEMEFISLTSLSMCSANSFLPWMSLNGLRPDAEIPEELVNDGIVDGETGLLDKAKLHQKLRQLIQARQTVRAFR